MKIAELVGTFPPYHGGTGYVCYHNSLELARLGHDVTVFTFDFGLQSYRKDPEEFQIIRLKPPFFYRDGGTLPQLYGRLKYFDIVHLHYPFFGGAEFVYLACLLRKQKYFITYHMDVFGYSLLGNLIIKTYDTIFLKKIITKSSFIIAPGMKFLESTKIAGFVDWKKVSNISLGGVDTEIFAPGEKKKELLTKYHLEDKKIVLFVGNFIECKGFDVLINAMTAIKDQNIVLVAIGGGYNKSEYIKQVKVKKLNGRIIFTGPKLNSTDLPDYYNLADFLVLPSTMSESFGLVILEAMACAKPVITTDLPGPSKLVDVGKDGLLVKSGDAIDLKEKIEYMAYNHDIRQAMGTIARKKVEKMFTWKEIALQIERKIMSSEKER